MLDNIFIITSVSLFDRNTDGRPWGFYHNLQTARDYLVHDKFDISECLYDYCVIEEYREGIGVCSQNEEWYKLNEDFVDGFNSRWIRCEKPVEIRNIMNWGIG